MKRRLVWLLVCAVAGITIGAIGNALTQAAEWFLAIPVALAAGWLWWADPTQCETTPVPPRRGADHDPG